jgi:hypothetical protein
MDFRHHESSIHRLHQSRSLRRPEVRLRVPRAIRLLKTSHKQILPSRFFDDKNAQNEFALPFDTLKRRIIDFTKFFF